MKYNGLTSRCQQKRLIGTQTADKSDASHHDGKDEIAGAFENGTHTDKRQDVQPQSRFASRGASQ
ncbi:MAG: hypothetical protein V3T13_07320, partial [Hyphomicrobium sp.]